MPTDKVAKEFYEVSKLSKYDFQPYWPEKKLKICVTGAGGFIASHLAKRLKSEGHYIIGCDWKRNEHMPVRVCHLSSKLLFDHRWTEDCFDLLANGTGDDSAGGNVLRRVPPG
jgi:GDP-D-mannose 3',5'-epimerase